MCRLTCFISRPSALLESKHTPSISCSSKCKTPQTKSSFVVFYLSDMCMHSDFVFFPFSVDVVLFLLYLFFHYSVVEFYSFVLKKRCFVSTILRNHSGALFINRSASFMEKSFFPSSQNRMLPPGMREQLLESKITTKWILTFSNSEDKKWCSIPHWRREIVN